MSLRTRLENLISEMLPPGTFWRSESSDRLVRGIGGALLDAAEFADTIYDTIQPETAPRSVLEQWWAYLQGTLACLGMPVTVDALRDAVVRLWRADFSGTFEGLQDTITAFLPKADVRDSLTVSLVPGEIPMPIEPTGRVLEIQYLPTEHTAEQVRCVARRFMRDGDALRLVTAASKFLSSDITADQVGVRWTYGTNATLVASRATQAGGSVAESVSSALSVEHDFTALSDLFPLLSASDEINDHEFTWRLRRDFGDGLEDVEAPRTVVPAAETLRTLVGESPAYLWPGKVRDAVANETLTAEGSADENQSPVGLRANGMSGRQFEFGGNTTDAFRASDNTVGDAGSSSFVGILVMRAFDVGESEKSVITKRADGSSAGWELRATNSPAGNAIFRVNNAAATEVEISLVANHVNVTLSCVVFGYNATAGTIRMASERASEVSASISGDHSNTETMVIGNAIAGALGMDVSLFALVTGAASESINVKTVADAVAAAMIA